MLIGNGSEHGPARFRQRETQRCRIDHEGDIAAGNPPARPLWGDAQRPCGDALLQQVVIGEWRCSNGDAQGVGRVRTYVERDAIDFKARVAGSGFDKAYLAQTMKTALLEHIE